MHKVSIFLLLLLLVSSISAQDTFIPAVLYGGFSVIFTNDTSFLEEIDVHGGELYVSGGGLVRAVIESPFSLSYSPRYFAQNHSFVDYRVFDDIRNKTWVFGPITAHRVQDDAGINHPLHLSSSTDSNFFTLPNYLLSSVFVHNTNLSVTAAFLAGWVSDGTTANFTVIRIVIDTSNIQNQQFVTLNSSLVLSNSTGYDDYYRTFKPKIFRSHISPMIVVVDPSSHRIITISTTEDLQSPLSYINETMIPGRISGTTFDPDTNVLFVGVASLGTLPGVIVVINITNMAIINTINLANGQSNPRALDFRNGFLYIGLTGGHAILQYELATQKIKYSTIPWYLNNLQALTTQRDNFIYFVTYEQRAKVARTSVSNFCDKECDHNFGWCESGTCHCISGYALSQNGQTCAIQPADVSYTAEIALGLLFAITLLSGGFGWFLVWRIKRQATAKKTGYFARADEHDTFLGDEDN